MTRTHQDAPFAGSGIRHGEDARTRITIVTAVRAVLVIRSGTNHRNVRDRYSRRGGKTRTRSEAHPWIPHGIVETHLEAIGPDRHEKAVRLHLRALELHRFHCSTGIRRTEILHGKWSAMQDATAQSGANRPDTPTSPFPNHR